MLCCVERSPSLKGFPARISDEVMEKKEVVFTTLTPIVWLLDASRQQESGSAKQSRLSVKCHKTDLLFVGNAENLPAPKATR